MSLNSRSSVSPQIQRSFSESVFAKTLKMAGSEGAKILSILQKAGGVLGTIVRNPGQFINNLVKAIHLGFNKFKANISNHLKNGLVGWLFGVLSGSGLSLPTQFDAQGTVSIMLQVLNLNYQVLRQKLAKKVGEQKVSILEKRLDFLRNIATGGLITAWQQIIEFASNLPEMVMSAIQSWVINKVITSAITKLISMFNPVGAFIQAVMAIYNTIMFFIERATQIAVLAESVFAAIGKIVSGNVEQAGSYIEQLMARSLPVIISFLARLLGLSGISKQIKNVIGKIQAPVNKALDKLVDLIVNKGQAFLGANKSHINTIPKKSNKVSTTNKPTAKGSTTPKKSNKVSTTNKPTAKGSKDQKKSKTNKDTKNDKQNKNQNPVSDTKTVEIPFTMKDKQHTLFLILGAKPSLEMASKRDRLSNKIGRAISKLQAQPSKTAEQIKQITDLKEIGVTAKKIQQDQNKKQTPELQNKIEEQSKKLTITLSQYALNYGVNDIDEILGTVGTPLERVKKTFNVPSLPRLFVQSTDEQTLANLLCSHHADLNGLINNDANKMRELIIEIKDDIANKLKNLINLNKMLPAGQKIIKLDRKNANVGDPDSQNLVAKWASCSKKAEITVYISNNGFEEFRKLVKFVAVGELDAAIYIIALFSTSHPNRLQQSKMPGWAHVYQNYPPGGGISRSISFNPSMLAGHIEKHLCNRDGNPDKDEPWKWMQRLGHSVTLAEIQTLVNNGHATLTNVEQNHIFGAGNSIDNQTSARYFFTTYLDNNPSVVTYLRDKWKSAYSDDATNSIKTGRAFIHSDDSGGATGTPIHISADANPVFVIAKYVTNNVLISSAYIPVNLSTVVSQNEAHKVWDL